MVWYYDEGLEITLLEKSCKRAREYLRMADISTGSLFTSDVLLISNNYSNLPENYRGLANDILLSIAALSTVAALYDLLKCRQLTKKIRERIGSINKLENSLK